MLAEGQTTVQYYAKILYGILSCEMFLRDVRVGIDVLESILPEPKTQNLVLLGLINNPLVKHWEATHTRFELRSVRSS